MACSAFSTSLGLTDTTLVSLGRTSELFYEIKKGLFTSNTCKELSTEESSKGASSMSKDWDWIWCSTFWLSMIISYICISSRGIGIQFLFQSLILPEFNVPVWQEDSWEYKCYHTELKKKTALWTQHKGYYIVVLAIVVLQVQTDNYSIQIWLYFSLILPKATLKFLRLHLLSHKLPADSFTILNLNKNSSRG